MSDILSIHCILSHHIALHETRNSPGPYKVTSDIIEFNTFYSNEKTQIFLHSKQQKRLSSHIFATNATDIL